VDTNLFGKERNPPRRRRWKTMNLRVFFFFFTIDILIKNLSYLLLRLQICFPQDDEEEGGDVVAGALKKKKTSSRPISFSSSKNTVGRKNLAEIFPNNKRRARKAGNSRPAFSCRHSNTTRQQRGGGGET
jgi:hypothetical protein